MGDQAREGSQGPGQLPEKSPPPSSRMSLENPGSAQEEADNLPSHPRQTGWRTWSTVHFRSLGKTHHQVGLASIKVTGKIGFRRWLQSKERGRSHTQGPWLFLSRGRACAWTPTLQSFSYWLRLRYAIFLPPYLYSCCSALLEALPAPLKYPPAPSSS